MYQHSSAIVTSMLLGGGIHNCGGNAHVGMESYGKILHYTHNHYEIKSALKINSLKTSK
jgi:hypothetical protein